jgi:integrase
MTKIKLPYLNEYRDRHGRMRRYVRRPGCRSVAIPGLPGSPAFMDAYRAAMDGPAPKPHQRVVSGSLKALTMDYFVSIKFTKLAPGSQALYRKAINPVLEKDGHRLAADMPSEMAETIIAEIGARSPGMANIARAVLRNVFKIAIKRKIRKDNPFVEVPKYELGSHHTWTEAELQQFETRWPLGTRQRLAYDLLLWTTQRVGDVARMGRADIAESMIRGVQQKTGTEFAVPIRPELAASMRACPAKGLSLIGDTAGRPYSSRGLQAMMARAIEAAGLPERCVAHGLRKAGMRRLAEKGASTKQLQAISGHKTLAEVQRYTDAAEREGLARDGMAKLDGSTNRGGV